MRSNKLIKKKNPLRIEPRFSSEVVSRLIGRIMKHGKIKKAMKIVYSAADIIEEKGFSFLDYLNNAIDKLKISSELKSFRRGSSNQRIPVFVSERRSSCLALYWIVSSTREEKKNKKISKDKNKKKLLEISISLAEEIININNDSGLSIKKKKAIENEVSTNMAFSSIRKK